MSWISDFYHHTFIFGIYRESAFVLLQNQHELCSLVFKNSVRYNSIISTFTGNQKRKRPWVMAFVCCHKLQWRYKMDISREIKGHLVFFFGINCKADSPFYLQIVYNIPTRLFKTICNAAIQKLIGNKRPLATVIKGWILSSTEHLLLHHKNTVAKWQNHWPLLWFCLLPASSHQEQSMC